MLHLKLETLSQTSPCLRGEIQCFLAEDHSLRLGGDSVLSLFLAKAVKHHLLLFYDLRLIYHNSYLFHSQ